MSLTDAWMQWKEWLTSLSPEFVFLLVLPFLVALAAFLRHGLSGPRTGAPSRKRTASSAGSRDSHLVA